MMHVRTAQLPPGGGDDAIITTGDGVIMLDGASAFIPVPVPASVYSGHLARQIARGMDARPGADLRGILADAIAATARDLDLRAGKSPSSTVIILWYAGEYADCLVLGDSLAILAASPSLTNGSARFAPASASDTASAWPKATVTTSSTGNFSASCNKNRPASATGQAATGSPKPTRQPPTTP